MIIIIIATVHNPSRAWAQCLTRAFAAEASYSRRRRGAYTRLCGKTSQRRRPTRGQVQRASFAVGLVTVCAEIARACSRISSADQAAAAAAAAIGHFPCPRTADAEEARPSCTRCIYLSARAKFMRSDDECCRLTWLRRLLLKSESRRGPPYAKNL